MICPDFTQPHSVQFPHIESPAFQMMSRATPITSPRLRIILGSLTLSLLLNPTTPSSTAKPPSMCGNGVCDAQAAETFGTCSRDCQSLNDRADYFTELLQPTFEGVDEGIFGIFEAAQCADVPVCYNNNPTSPYGRLLFKLAPGEPDPDPDNRRGSPPGMEDWYTGHRLRPGDSLVWIGRTPPNCPYYSFTSYVFSRFDPQARGEPPYGDRVSIFASLGDSENQLTLNTGIVPVQTPFDQESVVIFTADRNADRLIRRTLARAGFPASRVNTLVFPRFKADGVTPKSYMGYQNEADIFSILMRIASPDVLQPGTAIRAWLDHPGARVFRVRAADAFPLDPFPLPPLRPHGDGVSEGSASLDRLVQSIKAAHSGARMETRTALPTEAEIGDYCLDNLTQCNGDCRDTPYMSATFRLGRDPESIIVAGRNHEKSGKATYVNITATRVVSRTAYYSILMDELAGSAELYLPNDPDAKNLWQVKFARHCHDEPYCYELSEDQIPVNGLVAIMVRAYLDPATGTSPKVFPIDESEIVFPRVIDIN